LRGKAHRRKTGKPLPAFTSFPRSGLEVVCVRLGDSARCGRTKITGIGDVRNLRPTGANHISLVAGENESSTDTGRPVPGVLRRDFELRIATRDPVGAKTRGDGKSREWMPAVLDVLGVIVSTDVARQKIRSAADRLCMKNPVALGGIVGIVQCGVFLNDAAAVGIVGSDLAEFMPLEVEAGGHLIRPCTFRDVIRHVAGNRFLLCGFTVTEARIPRLYCKMPATCMLISPMCRKWSSRITTTTT
jgi:hypothetical protein